MRVAGAQARRVLLDAAAEKWGVPVAELTTEPNVVVHKASGRRFSYGEIAAFATRLPAELPKIADSDLKLPSELPPHRQGRAAASRCPLKTTGAAKFGIDVQVPGMVYAAVLHSPYLGRPAGNPRRCRSPRNAGRHRRGEAAGWRRVVGSSVEATQAAKNALKVTWSAAPAATLDSERALDDLTAIARDKSRSGVSMAAIGDAKAAMQNAAVVFQSEVYRTRYVYHAQMEPLNATVSTAVDGQSAEVWSGTQGPSGLAAEVAGLP